MRLISIGVIKSPYKTREEAPKQGIDSEEASTIVLYEPEILEKIKKHKCLLVLYWMHLSDREVLWSESKGRGVFATRSPERPNPIAISVVKVVRIKGNEIRVKYLDAVDGTPVIDVRPLNTDVGGLECGHV
ncbi:MAG: tRNA (N6-threonylcarbamoyladenosine(37)-N6)-methyltransferase TrmO [Euryarchaeota archaeon]|nr:tRNA (N6-threonylcarbamoyladenosine(37)-N6)-methyltransferase TrmO [Euryarchaeota archaeon]